MAMDPNDSGANLRERGGGLQYGKMSPLVKCLNRRTLEFVQRCENNMVFSFEPAGFLCLVSSHFVDIHLVSPFISSTFIG